MRIETHTSDRKQIAWAIGSHLDKPVHYDGVPRCSYSVGPFTVERDGAVTCEDAAAMEALIPMLRERGWVSETEAQCAETESAPVAVTTEAEAVPEEDAAAEQPAEAESTGGDCEAAISGTGKGMSVRYSLAEFTAAGFTNFIKTLYTRQKLINSMFRKETLVIDEETMLLLKEMNTDDVEKLAKAVHSETALGFNRGIDIDEGALHIDIPFDEAAPDSWKHAAALLNRAADKAKEAHHASGKIIVPEPDAYKYFCHSWLIALGFGGPDFKELRAALLDHLPGYAAFRSAEKMDAHKAKFTERRRAARAQKEANGNAEN